MPREFRDLQQRQRPNSAPLKYNKTKNSHYQNVKKKLKQSRIVDYMIQKEAYRRKYMQIPKAPPPKPKKYSKIKPRH